MISFWDAVSVSKVNVTVPLTEVVEGDGGGLKLESTKSFGGFLLVHVGDKFFFSGCLK